jgi:hypothetical protein
MSAWEVVSDVGNHIDPGELRTHQRSTDTFTVIGQLGSTSTADRGTHEPIVAPSQRPIATSTRASV